MLLCDLVFQICFNSSGTTLNLTGDLMGLSNILWEEKYDVFVKTVMFFNCLLLCPPGLCC
jgi:hypothetical protein